MANPQVENGHVRLATEVVEALARVNLSAYEWRVLWAVIRRTYGWRKKTDFISLLQISAMTGIAKPHACYAKRRLLKKHILYEDAGKLGLQKDYEQWTITDSGNVTDLGNGVTDLGNKSLPIQAPQKIRKILIQKQYIFRPNSDEFRLAELLLDLILQRSPNFQKGKLKGKNGKEKLLQKWVADIDKLIRIDGREPKHIEKVIRWCQADPFWQNNILSTEKLRKQFDQLELKMKGTQSDHRNKTRDRDFAGQRSSVGHTIEM